MRKTVQEVELKGYVTGAVGRITELHAVYYHQEWGFGQFFEVKVAGELSAFLERFDETRDGFWTACLNGRVEGSIVIDGANAESEGAHLRWFILSPEVRGRGLGNRLMDTVLRFCRDLNYARVYLWTFEGLHAARHLYEKFGFELVAQHEGNQWGTRAIEQKFLLEIKSSL
ncbi:MAG: GNAT family N-acetyltransferase [Pseudomonadota bacterium]